MPESRRVRALFVALILALVVALFSVDYTVQRGDTLGKIARDNGVSVSELAEANGISNPNLIHPGQVLVIPGEEGEPDQLHEVARGETLNRISARYGVKTSEIVSANALNNPNLIYPGQKLLIPGVASTQSAGGSGEAESDETEPDETSPPPASTTGRSGQYHVVKRGETPYTIATLYAGVSAEDIAMANGIINGVIYSGTRLYLDGPGYVATGTGGQSTYAVNRGDRLADIAARFSTSVSRLAELNGISNPNLIRSGQVLTVPGGGSWVCPVSGATFFNDWGFPRSGGRFHNGNDLFASYNTPVVAPVSGEVKFKIGNIGGNQFNLYGDDGTIYIGSHMDSFEGGSRRVSAGEVLGYIGTTGNAVGTRPHLHFEIHHDGVTANPYPTLVANGCK